MIHLNAEDLLSPKGRRGRRDFIIVCLGVSVLSSVIQSIPVLHQLVIPSLLLSYVGFTNTAKRLHDLNLSAWWAGLMYVVILTFLISAAFIAKMQPPDFSGPLGTVFIVSGIFLAVTSLAALALVFKKGTDGDNKYGPNPLNPPDQG